MIKLLGHDGSKIIDPYKPEPWNRQAFGYSEMAWALIKRGWALISLHAGIEGVDTYPPLDHIENGILIVAKDHALAIKDYKLYDGEEQLTMLEWSVKQVEFLFRINNGT